VRQAGLRPVLVRRGAADGLPWIGADGTPLEVVRERDDGPRHPLNGVVSALEHAAGESVLVLPCDVVGLEAAHLHTLVVAPCVARVADRVHPLVAHLPADRLPAARALVRDGGAARDLVAGLPECVLDGLLDRNRSEGPWPLERLLTRLAWLPEAARERIARAECVRQRARGVVDPSASRYAPEPQRREHG
jgi:hypothetical protein